MGDSWDDVGKIFARGLTFGKDSDEGSAKLDPHVAKDGNRFAILRAAFPRNIMLDGSVYKGAIPNISVDQKRSGSSRRDQAVPGISGGLQPKAPWEDKNALKGQFGAEIDGKVEENAAKPWQIPIMGHMVHDIRLVTGDFSITSQGGFGRYNGEVARVLSPRPRGERIRLNSPLPPPAEGGDGEEKNKNRNRGRRRPMCSNCGRFGHSTGLCYRGGVENPSPKEIIRCYNCRGLGHLAVSCPKVLKAQKQKERPAYRPESPPFVVVEEEENAADEKNSTKSSVNNSAAPGNAAEEDGLRIICELMKDTHLRKKAARCAPDLYNGMIDLLVSHVQEQQEK